MEMRSSDNCKLEREREKSNEVEIKKPSKSCLFKLKTKENLKKKRRKIISDKKYKEARED